MELKEFITKENLRYLGGLVKKLPFDILFFIMVALFFIALIIDFMIAHTFPAYTLIAGIIFLTVSYCKISLKIRAILQQKDTQKEQEKNFNDIYSETEPYLNLLDDSEKQLLKRFIDENKLYIVYSLQEYTLYGVMVYKGINFINAIPYPQLNKEPLYIMKISKLHFYILKKYFEFQNSKL